MTMANELLTLPEVARLLQVRPSASWNHGVFRPEGERTAVCMSAVVISTPTRPARRQPEPLVYWSHSRA
jgi:hypothetical protein